MRRHLLICGVSEGMEPTLEGIACEHDVSVSVVTDRPEAVRGLPVGSIVAYPRDLDDVMRALAAHGVTSVDGVTSLGYENPPVVSRLARTFACPGLPVELADRCTYKHLRIRALAAAGIRTPRHVVVASRAQAQEAARALGFPVVFKPVDGTSSTGVIMVRDDERVGECHQYVSSVTGRPVMVVEEYVPGSEHTVEGVVYRGEVHVAAFSDRNYQHKHEFDPFIFEDGDDLPTALPAAARDAVVAEAIRALKALELDDTVFSTDMLLSSRGQPYVLEVAARMSGSRFGTDVVPQASGVRIVPSVVRLALGEPIDLNDLVPTRYRHVASRHLPARGGRVVHVGELRSDGRADGLLDVFWERELKVGQVLPRYRSAKDVVAGAIAYGNSRQEAAAVAEGALRALPLRLEPCEEG